ncbi:uncharacterized protein EDB93DRAFT_1107524 [Suillus bovinus]|uniref:uncharacterized protein n=1 Tax=Suillus bovinus TaxID=48563 RepID=UPI001B85F891|nr:uncharacterized protein EDB93DRAFT_1107524 [Suillus bovinus]KAG2133573.1 hypothetical protein EDB93DRAFT_1107524 [Suillus bovinus]
MSSHHHPNTSSSSSDPPEWSESPEPSRPSKRKHRQSSSDTSTNDLINSISSGSRKHTTRKHEDSKTDDTELYRNAGRKASSLLDTFGIPSAAFKTGLQFDRGGKHDPKQPEDVTNRHLLLYNGVIDYVPGLESELDHISSKKLNVIIAMVSKGMSDGRSADLSSVKHKGLQYIGLNMYSKADALDPPVPEIKDKSMRGLNHPQLAHAMAALQAGKIIMTAHNWPTFFYEHDIYDAAEKTHGLFQNHIVLRFYKHLFIGPSSIMNDSSNVRNSAKPSKNRAWGLMAVNKYTIAYVYIITYFTISSTQHWTRCIGDMDLDELLWAIIEMLDDDDDPWVKDTLAWWNRHLKPTKDNLHSAKLMRKESEDDIAQIRAQRAACRSALAKSNAPSCPGHPNKLQEPSTSGKRICPVEHRPEEDIPHAPKRIRQANEDLSSPRPQKGNTRRHASAYDNDDDNDEEVAATLPKQAHPQLDGQQQPLPNQSLPQHCHGVIFSDDEEDELVPARKPTYRSEFDAQEQLGSDPHVPRPLPPKFKPWYSIEVADHNTAPASMRAGHSPADSVREDQRLRQHCPASASIHHNDEDQPPRIKPKPKPKPHHTARNEREYSVGELMTEQQWGMIGESQPVTAPSPPRPSSPLSDLTDNNNFTPPPLAQPSKQKGRRKTTTAPDAPHRTSGRRKNGY